jgi:class 3 adenylate cyclase/predicted ATPase
VSTLDPVIWGTWAVIDIDDWLERLGLEQYAPAFRANAIDGSVLPKLTADDLKELGVTLVGHRRKLLDAITILREAIASDRPAIAEPVIPPFKRTITGAERRQLTVMFCDLVDSTSLSTALDPEDLREVIGAYNRCVAQNVARFDGFIARYMGDGALIFFGYPQAHEDDAERAVRTGLALVDAIGNLEAPRRLQTHVGIATGLVVVGDLIGGGDARSQDVVGETPNLAARLEALAEPNTIVIADSTRAQIGAMFEVEDLGPLRLKGFAEPQRAWRILGESRVHSRFEALRSGQTPLVDRVEEIALLLRRWAQAKDRAGQVVLLSAEPGVGKSRILAALEERLQDEQHIRLRFFCSPYHQDSALYPIIAYLEQAADFQRDDQPETKLDKLVALVAPTLPSEYDIALLADLLSLPASPLCPLPDLTPESKKEKTFEALLRQFGNLARQRPVLMIFEDLQWVDPTSRELLDLIINRIERWAMLLTPTFRPEFQPPWTGRPQVTLLSLSRLSRHYARAIVQQLKGAAVTLPSDVAEEIVERCDGVPLFLEELTKAVLEQSAGHDRASGAVSIVPAASPTVPATLQASLMARLDRLGPVAKEVAQIGAAIGRGFSFELLTAAASRHSSELQCAITMLVEAGLVFRQGTPLEESLLFKHALVQEAAYGTLLRGPRQLLHGRIADALLSTSGKSAAAPEIVAQHLQNAGRSGEAMVYWRRAAEQAVRRAANREGIEHFRRALSLLEMQPETAERWRIELAILDRLSAALMNVHGRSAPEVGDAVERAAEVGRRLESSADLAPTMANLWRLNLGRGRIDRADEISADLFRIAREVGDPEIMLQAHHTAWPARWVRGLLAEASEHAKAGLMLYDEERHAHHRYIYFGHDPAMCALAVDGVVQWARGYPARAACREEKAMTLARKLQDAPSLAHALWLVCESRAARGDDATVMDTARELLSLSEQNALSQPGAYSLIFLGWSLARSGDVADGIARLEEGLSILGRMGVRSYLTRSLCLMGESLLAARRYAEGLHQVARGIDIAMEIGEHWYVSRLHQVNAELLLHAHGLEDGAVEAALRQALAVAQQQGAKGWELRAATSLAQLWVDRGNREAASNLLAPIYSWFTEGLDTPDLCNARMLLDALG